MIGPETLAALIARHGLAIVAPVALVEGPIVTVIAAWLASRGLFPVWAVALVMSPSVPETPRGFPAEAAAYCASQSERAKPSRV